MDGSPPGSSVRGTLQARILEWVAIPSSKGSSGPRNRTCISLVSCIAGGFLPLSHHGCGGAVIKHTPPTNICASLGVGGLHPDGSPLTLSKKVVQVS